jgi:E3 ubiquitin-protein ligase EDD1
MDESLSHVCGKLEQQATLYSEFQNDRVATLHTCVLYTGVRMESGNFYWWGILPFGQRKRMLEKYTNKKRLAGGGNSSSVNVTATDLARSGSRRNRLGADASSSAAGTGSSAISEISVGSQVCMKNAPVYQAGSIGFTVAGGVPKVGQLLGAAWNITDACRFKIVQPPKRPKLPELPREKDKAKEEYDSASMPPPPSPASSTCSDGSMSSPAVGRRQKRSAPKDCPEKIDEEGWNLKDVIFIEDSRSIPTGRVIKVDGPYVAVKFSQMSGSSSSGQSGSKDKKEEDDTLNNDNIRLLRKDELQVVKSGMMPRMPECFQRAPKKVSLQLHGSDGTGVSNEVLAISIDAQGIHAVVRNVASNKMSYKIFSLSSGKVDTDSKFPTETHAFLGSSLTNVRFQVMKSFFENFNRASLHFTDFMRSLRELANLNLSAF